MSELPRRSFPIPDDVMEGSIMPLLPNPATRAAISATSKQWYHFDSHTRRHLTIYLSYTTTPSLLPARFPRLVSLKLKGKPRASMFHKLIPDDWGGSLTPWVGPIADGLLFLESLHLRRMVVADSDLAVLVGKRGCGLKVLKLDKCSGFSTDGLLTISRGCRYLRTLFLEDSSITEKDSEWFHELAMTHTHLETLNFFLTYLQFSFKDLELIARNCRSLVSVKISEFDNCDLSDLVGFFESARALEEFCGGCISDKIQVSDYENVRFPSRLCSLALSYLSAREMHVIFPFGNALKKLDLLYTFLFTEHHCQLIQHCPNLETLEVMDEIGDRGLEVVARTCRRLRKLRIERGSDEAGEDGIGEQLGRVTHRGLSAVAQGCPELEYLAVYVTDITNAALVSIGTCCPNLSNFRMVLLEREERIADLPLDNGVRALLSGCPKITRLAIYLRPGGLSDVGLGYIGELSKSIEWMLLGCVGESDLGLLQLARGCQGLEKLELRGCCFSDRALALAVVQLASLKYLWVDGYVASPTRVDLAAMVRPFWNIELIPERVDIKTCRLHPAQILAYYSLAGQRNDIPSTVVPYNPE